MEARITFSNGVVITAQQNGSSYIVPTKPAFPTNLDGIVIVNDEGQTTIEHGQIVECASIDGNDYWFTIIETPISEIKEQRVDSRISDIENALCELTV